MKNLRKLMAVIVSVAIMASLLVAPAFAEQTMTDVEVCELLDVLKGTGSGLTAEYLASKPQRYQAARLFLRLQGLEDDALAFEGTANFSDVEAMPDWQFAAENKAVLAYLYANPELGFVGYTDGTFRPFNEISAMEYYKVLLTALGYEQNVDYVYGDDLLDFAEGLGLSEVADVEDFTIMHLATATVEGLKAVVRESEETLIEKLVADGVIAEDLAAETGIYGEEVEAVELAVDSVTADNLAEVYVKFNQAMDKSTIKADYFKVAGDKVQAASLMADGVTAKLTVALAKVAGSNGANYKVEVTKDVKSASGEALAAAYSTTIKVIDKELPVITGVELTGPKTIEITFSEPIKDKPTVKINKGIYGCSVSDISSVTGKIVVTIAASKLPEATYSLEITGAKDYAGFKMDDDTRDLAYAADSSPITAEVTSATQSEVKVKFSKRVTLKSGEEESYFYHTFSSHRPIAATSSDNRTWTLRFVKTSGETGVTEYPIPEGTTQLVIKYKGSSGTQIADEWGNKLDSNIVIPITVSADVTDPTVVGEVKVVDARNIKIYFSESLDKDSVEEEKNYVVEDKDGKKREDFTATYEVDSSKSEYVAKLTFDADLKGDYTVTVKDVTDASVNKNELASTTLSFFVKDMVAPVMGSVDVTCIEGASDGKDIIYVNYKEKMTTEGKYSVLDASNYLLTEAGSTTPAKLPDKTTLELFGSTGEVVKITLPNSGKNINGGTLTIARVADLEGNVSIALATPRPISLEASPQVTAIAQTADNKLTFTVNKALQSVLADAFIVTVGTTDYKAAGVEEWTVKDGKTTVKVVLTAACVGALKAAYNEAGEIYGDYGKDTSLLVTGAGGTIKIAGEFILSETGKKASGTADDPDALTIAVVDKWAPTYKEMAVSVSGGVYSATLGFSEALYSGSKDHNFAQDLVVKNLKGDTLVADTDYETSIDANGKLVVTFINRANVLEKASEGKYFTIASKDSITYIKDEATKADGVTPDGNKIATFTAQKVKDPD